MRLKKWLRHHHSLKMAPHIRQCNVSLYPHHKMGILYYGAVSQSVCLSIHPSVCLLPVCLSEEEEIESEPESDDDYNTFHRAIGILKELNAKH